jgi:hypothetical protein
VSDQAEIVPQLRDETIQDHAYAAVGRFVSELASTRRFS